VLVDGNRHQIEQVQAEAARRQVEITTVVDFIHVIEYVWKAAWSFFTPGDPDAQAWVAGKAALILKGKARQVAAGIRRRATTYGYTGGERAGADACADYLTTKAPHLDYVGTLDRRIRPADEPRPARPRPMPFRPELPARSWSTLPCVNNV